MLLVVQCAMVWPGGGEPQAGVCCVLLRKGQKKQVLGWPVGRPVFIIKRIFYPRPTASSTPATLSRWSRSFVRWCLAYS